MATRFASLSSGGSGSDGKVVGIIQKLAELDARSTAIPWPTLRGRTVSIPAHEVIGGYVDPAPQPGAAYLVGRIVIRRPLQPNVGHWALLELEHARLDRVASHAARKVFASS